MGENEVVPGNNRRASSALRTETTAATELGSSQEGCVTFPDLVRFVDALVKLCDCHACISVLACILCTRETDHGSFI